MRLAGKVALIYGASGRMGQTIAALFAQEGAAVGLAARQEDPLNQLRYAIVERGGLALVVRADVTQEADARNAVEETVAAFDHIDIMVYAAGGYLSGDIPAAETGADDWDGMLRMNLTGAFFAAKYALPEMARFGGGSAVIISAARRARLFGNVAYSASKEAVLGLVTRLAREYKPRNVRVNALLPYSVSAGPERTPIVPRAEPLSAGGLPEDAAFAALFLASDEARFITGAALPVDGGSDL